MKVLSFSYCFPNSADPTWGVFVLQRLAALAKLAEVQVVSPRPVFPVWSALRGPSLPEVDEMAGLTIYRPRFFYVPGLLKTMDARFYNWGLMRWVEDLVRREKPDVLDSHFIWPDGVGVYRMARRLGVPFTITMRGKIYPCLDSPSMTRQCAEALQHASAVISVDTPMAEIAVRLGAARERVHVIRNGVDKDFFRLRPKAQARRELGLPVDGQLIVAVAHLKRTKGHGETIQALAKLPGSPRLVIVGGAPGGDRFGQEARELAARLGVADRVTFAGRQPHAKIPLYLAAADVSVLASYREGCPNVVLESIACGTPVVATRVGAVPEIVTPGQNGQIVPPRDVDALAQGIAGVLACQWSPEALRESATVRPWTEVAQAVYNVFEGIVGRQPIHSVS